MRKYSVPDRLSSLLQQTIDTELPALRAITDAEASMSGINTTQCWQG